MAPGPHFSRKNLPDLGHRMRQTGGSGKKGSAGESGLARGAGRLKGQCPRTISS